MSWLCGIATLHLLRLCGPCRSGVVVSLAESSETFVMQKLAKRLGIAIPMLKLREGVIEPVPAAGRAACVGAGGDC